jgi:hypothetical protein
MWLTDLLLRTRSDASVPDALDGLPSCGWSALLLPGQDFVGYARSWLLRTAVFSVRRLREITVLPIIYLSIK